MSVPDTEQSVLLVAEAGVNHNASLDVACQLVTAAAQAGADYVKFQKRDPEACVPREQWDVERDTPWGRMTYIEYKRLMEFDEAAYEKIDRVAAEHGIGWFLSVWDTPSLVFALQWKAAYVKIPSALLTNAVLVGQAASACAGTANPDLVLSTGMSTSEQIEEAVRVAYASGLKPHELWLLHCHSAYPAPTRELNLRCIETLRRQYPGAHIGYSGHELGIATTEWAVVVGAEMVERHLTVDKTMWGSDQMASLEPLSFERLVRHVHSVRRALGDGVKVVHDSEKAAMQRLRPTPTREPVGPAGGIDG